MWKIGAAGAAIAAAGVLGFQAAEPVTGFETTVAAPRETVERALLDLDVPDQADQHLSFSNETWPSRTPTGLQWRVISGGAYTITTLAVDLESIEGGKATRLVARIIPGDAPAERLDQAWRAPGTTAALFRTLVDGELGDIGVDHARCRAIVAANTPDRRSALSQPDFPLPDAALRHPKVRSIMTDLDERFAGTGCRADRYVRGAYSERRMGRALARFEANDVVGPEATARRAAAAAERAAARTGQPATPPSVTIMPGEPMLDPNPKPLRPTMP
ncbi:hypothetical protein [Sphingomonas sp.]|uniref:hypothetical protein n=1 Tax=Sphingomonas sp. TaxID=28214 RepID=UPI002DD67EAE|nr:hypothetical protein [Sphingomonas sp.]